MNDPALDEVRAPNERIPSGHPFQGRPFNRTTAPNSSRMAFLDYLRVFAFISVLIGHKFYNHLSVLATDNTQHALLRQAASIVQPLCFAGGVGVVTFFLVSGYIITHVLTAESAAEFAIKRIFRIYPLYMFAVILELCLQHYVQGTPLPPITVLAPRLLLIGDFFGTPYALAGVEWTLRLEIMFYAIMTGSKILGLLRHPATLLAVLLMMTVALQIAEPISSQYEWSRGYVTLYLPFLFMGTCAYFAEKRRINAYVAFAFGSYVYLSHMALLPVINPKYASAHFPTLAICIFCALWAFKNRLALPGLLIFLSDLTYSVYIFHNWLWNYIVTTVRWVFPEATYNAIPTLIGLLIFCALVERFVERNGRRLGTLLARAAQCDRSSRTVI
jgi:peptidoglycan/LPS O-acetylase OafA/YrhL